MLSEKSLLQSLAKLKALNRQTSLLDITTHSWHSLTAVTGSKVEKNRMSSWTKAHSRLINLCLIAENSSLDLLVFKRNQNKYWMLSKTSYKYPVKWSIHYFFFTSYELLYGKMGKLLQQFWTNKRIDTRRINVIFVIVSFWNTFYHQASYFLKIYMNFLGWAKIPTKSAGKHGQDQ